ncbi:MAG: ATP-binding protein [Candidatus Cloacimonetes bacterium]|nr:ATP-binding protein [Candidatus Cloacimonadota bacterium]
MLINRNLSKNIIKSVRGFPIITITGPRQSGKTTFTKMNFPDYDYVTMEDPDLREYAISDPRDFIRKYSNKVIIDEFQRVPQLTSYLQGHIDKINEPWMYILTGSNQFEHLHSISQTLAGRSAILKLLPFSYNELYSKQNSTIDIYEIISKGWYPRIFDQKLNHHLFYNSYFETYIQRDVRAIVNVRDLNDFQRFVRLCAGRTGQIVNLSNIANEIGVSHNTIKGWISILQASFIVELLYPYHRNFSKRIIKSPKLYFLDTGFACTLVGITKPEHLENHPLRGEIFETYVFAELLKTMYNKVSRCNIFYFRDSNNNEIDFLVETGEGLFPIEVKLNSTPRKMHFKNIQYFNKLSDQVIRNYLIYSGIENNHRYNCEIIGFPNIGNIDIF